MTKLLKRSEVNQQYTWDLTSLFGDDAAYQQAIDTLTSQTQQLLALKGKLSDAEMIASCLKAYMPALENAMQIMTYASLHASVDQSDAIAITRQAKAGSLLSNISSQLSFIESELSEAEPSVLQATANANPELKHYLDDIVREIPHRLHPEVEKALSALSPVLNAFYGIYNRSKLADLQFNEFDANDQKHALSFNLFENELEFDNNTNVRRAAYESFAEQLSKYQHTMAATYQSHIQKEKLLSTMRNHDSVIDYLLFYQKVEPELYHRQIDLIMTHLAPYMRKYAQLIKRVHKLDKLTIADLKLSIDPEFEPEITIEKSKEVLLEGLAPLGNEYLEMVKRSFDERWIDFENNIGKSTGAFCSSPYGNHPYILIGWTQRMRECFVLAHELGHAGHFYLAGKNQNILNTRPSLYFIEAPSTINELLVANHLLSQATDPRFKRWVLSTIISRTYYHNFVTHLLEAHYQRKVYDIIDQQGSIIAPKLNQLTLDTLKEFWGDDVEVLESAQYTWMRQPHYYMGLYPYTYSAGLTIATEVSKKVQQDASMIEKWKEVLSAGGTKTPAELAQMVDVDVSTDQPLLATIDTIGAMIDEIIALTDELEK